MTLFTGKALESRIKAKVLSGQYAGPSPTSPSWILKVGKQADFLPRDLLLGILGNMKLVCISMSIIGEGGCEVMEG